MISVGICKKEPKDLASVGTDYVELHFANLASLTDVEFEALRETCIAENVPVLASNSLLPGSVILSECESLPDFGLSDYLHRGYSRLSILGAKYSAIGSGRARNYTEAEGREAGVSRFVRFVILACDIAKQYGIKNLIEPLNSAETNLVTTVPEAEEVIEKAKAPENLGILADFYHMSKEESAESIRKYGKYIGHCHIANPETRETPLPDDGLEVFYKEYFSALAEIGYEGAVSIEASAPNGNDSYRESIPYIKNLLTTEKIKSNGDSYEKS